MIHKKVEYTLFFRYEESLLKDSSSSMAILPEGVGGLWPLVLSAGKSPGLWSLLTPG